MNGIFLGISLFSYMIVYIDASYYVKGKQGVLLENSFSEMQMADPRIQAVSQTYLKRLRQVLVFFSLFSIPLLFLTYDSLVLIYFFLLLISLIVVNQLLLVTFIQKMSLTKGACGWLESPSEVILTVDTKLSQQKNKKIIGKTWLIISFGLALFVALATVTIRPKISQAWPLTGLFLFLQVLVCYVYRAVYRLPAKVLTNDATVNQYCNDVAKRNWSLLIVIQSYCLVWLQGLVIGSRFLSWRALNLAIIGGVVIVLIMVGSSFYLLIDIQRKKNKCIQSAALLPQRNEDYFWRYGIYINPTDKRILVPDRRGLNMSINLGTKQGRFFIGLIGFACFALFVGFSMAMWQLDFSSRGFRTEVTPQLIVLQAPLTKTSKIPLKQVKEVTLLTKLPRAVRVNGTGTKQYSLGEYRLEQSDKEAKFYVNHVSNLYIEVQTQQQQYFFTGKDTKQTKAIYQALIK